jgi:hypothetical protein
VRAGWLAIVLVVLWVAPAAAHPLGPSSLLVDEVAPGVATARFQIPAGATLSPRWPADCTATTRAHTIAADVEVTQLDLRCPGALAGRALGVDGLAERDTIAIVRVRLAGGRVVRELLGPARPRFTIPASTSSLHVLAGYVRLGVDHLLGGLDHLLFILGLMLVVPGLRARALTLSAFTAGHSLTLALAVLGIVHVPPAPVEVLIAITLVIVALQALEPPARGRHTWRLAAAFGLVHGLGFAGVLTSAGLPPADVPLALLGFNLGLELAQLAIVVAAIGAAVAASSLVPRARLLAPRLRLTSAYAIGALATMWCLERTWIAWG